MTTGHQRSSWSAITRLSRSITSTTPKSAIARPTMRRGVRRPPGAVSRVSITMIRVLRPNGQAAEHHYAAKFEPRRGTRGGRCVFQRLAAAFVADPTEGRDSAGVYDPGRRYAHDHGPKAGDDLQLATLAGLQRRVAQVDLRAPEHVHHLRAFERC